MNFATSGHGEQNSNNYINWNLALDNQDPTPVFPTENIYPPQTLNYTGAIHGVESGRFLHNGHHTGFNTPTSNSAASYSAAEFQNQAIFLNQEPQSYFQGPYSTVAGVNNYPSGAVNTYSSGLNSTISLEAPFETILPLEIVAPQNFYAPLFGQEIVSGAIINHSISHFGTRELSTPIFLLGTESGLGTVVNNPFGPLTNVPVTPLEPEFGFGATVSSQFGLISGVPMVPTAPESQPENIINSEFALLANENIVSLELESESRSLDSIPEALDSPPSRLLVNEQIAPTVPESKQETVANPPIEPIVPPEPERAGATVSPPTISSENQQQSGPIPWTYYENQIESDSSEIESPRGDFKPIFKTKKGNPDGKKARPRKEIRMFTASQQLKLNFRKFKPCDPLIRSLNPGKICRETEQFDGDEDFWCHLCAKDDGFDRVYNFIFNESTGNNTVLVEKTSQTTLSSLAAF
ncbi:hypothetical protein BY996DRAFT_6414646 [Phakopsora pachyrhizi]|nr:hypothetical protein BY996DRAFT_6414646 [Phakopsora pachyrhizi]